MSTITREFTKEQLIEHIKGRKEFADECAADSTLHPERREYYELTAEALRIALASLEAEERADPVAFINGAWTLVYYRPPKELGLKIGDKLYTDPPAKVSVPAELTREEYKRRFMEEDDFDATFRGGWNACRSAMLQGADGNYPVIPDGWVMVPVEPTTNQWAAGMQAFDSGMDKVTRVYKAMLAAAPQQEAK